MARTCISILYPKRYKRSKASPISSALPWKYKQSLFPPSSWGKKRQGICSIGFFLGGAVIPYFLVDLLFVEVPSSSSPFFSSGPPASLFLNLALS